MFSSFFAAAQETESEAKKSKLKDKIYYTGNIGLSLGNNTNIMINPLIGYRVTEKYSAGIGINYQYVSNTVTDIHVYGGSVFNRYILTPEIFAHAEYETLTYKSDIIGEGTSGATTFPALLVGGGYRQSLGQRVSASAMILYDVLQHENSIYPDNIVLRGGVNLGF